MRIMYISSKNKNPMNNFEQKQPRNPKSQKPFCSTFSKNSTKNVNKLKKEGHLGLTHTWAQEPLKIWGRKRQKFLD